MYFYFNDAHSMCYFVQKIESSRGGTKEEQRSTAFVEEAMSYHVCDPYSIQDETIPRYHIFICLYEFW